MANPPQTIVGLGSIVSPSSAALLWVADPNANPQDRSFNLANLLAYLMVAGRLPASLGLPAPVLLSSGSPYTAAALTGSITYFIGATTNPFVFDLPPAIGSNFKLRVVNITGLATGLVKIVPYTGNQIAQLAANVACYLQNVDQGGNPYLFQFLDLTDVSTGRWAVTGGQFCPEPGSVDAAGTQYHLGTLHHLPLGNTADRTIYPTTNVPTVTNWSSAISATGIKGIPTGAKSLRARIMLVAYATAAGQVDLAIAFSDNNSNIPTEATSHPIVEIAALSTVANGIYGYQCEIDIPLNSSGQFFIYTLTRTNASGSVISVSSNISVIAVGYSMGD